MGALLAVVLLALTAAPPPAQGPRSYARVLDKRCRGGVGCTDRAVTRILSTAVELASGAALVGSKENAVTVTRSSNVTCVRSSSYFDPSQFYVNGDTFNGAGEASYSTTYPLNGFAQVIKFTDQAYAGFHGAVGQSPLSSLNTAAPWTVSVYLHAGTSHYVAVVDGAAGAGTVWDLATGLSLFATGQQTSSLTAVGGGWWRAVLSHTGIYGAGDNAYVVNNPSGSPTTVPSYMGAGATFYATGLKMEPGSTATTYVPGNNNQVVTLGTNVPCVESSGALWEGATTNLVTYSEDPSQSSWTKNNASVGARWILPNGQPGGWTLTDNSSSGFHGFYEGISITSSPVTASAIAKAGTSNCAAIFDGSNGNGATFNLSTGVVVAEQNWTARMVPLGGGFWRIAVTGTASATTNYWFMVNAPCGPPATGYAGTGSSIIIGAMQVESQGFATSYVPTGSTSAARSTQTASVSVPLGGNDWCVSGAFAAENRAWQLTQQSTLWVLGPFTGANSSFLKMDGGNFEFWNYDSSGTSKTVFTGVPAWGANTKHKILACNSNGVLSIALDGVPATLGSTGGGTGVVTYAAPVTMLLSRAGAEPFAWGSDYCVAAGAGVCR